MTEPTSRFDEWKRRQAQSRGQGGGGQARPQQPQQRYLEQQQPQQQMQQPQYRDQRPRAAQPQQYREQPRQQYREQPQARPAQPQQYREPQYRDQPQQYQQQYQQQAPQQRQAQQARPAQPQQYREPQAPQQQYRDEPRDLMQPDQPQYREQGQPQQQPQQEQQEQRYGEVSATTARDSARSRLDRFRQIYNSNQSEQAPQQPQQEQAQYNEQPQQQYREQPQYREQAPQQQYREQPQQYREQAPQQYREQPQPQQYREQAQPQYNEQQDSYSQQEYDDYDSFDNYGDEYDNDYYAAGDERAAQAVTDARDNLDDVDGFEDWDDLDTDDADTGDMYPVRQSNFADMDALDEQEDKEVETDNKSGGLLGWLRRLTGRGSSSGADTSEAVASMNRKLRQPQVIGIMGSKGGVGKTSKTQVIGSILAHYRTEGGVAAVDMDANSTLVDRMKPQTEIPDNASVHTFAHDDSIRSAADVNSYLVLNEEKLAVLAGIGRTGSKPLNRDELQRILDRLGEFYTLIILDFPGSAEVPVAVHALKVIDAMVYVAEITKSSLSATKRDLKRISQVRPELLSSATIILNHRTSGKVHIKNLEGHVEDFRNMGTRDVSTGASRVKVWETNYDPHIGIEGPIQISQLDPVNRTRYMQVAASIMDALPGTMPGYKRYAADHEGNQRTEVHELDD